ncbi:MAG: hypothetical protein WC744_04465 [Patescibacteria group bacterium]|jgi:hypothetical protein
MKTYKIPNTIKVRVKKLPKGKYFAELVGYGVFTETNNEKLLNKMVNDLIYTYFDISKEDQSKFYFRPKSDIEMDSMRKFIRYISPDFHKKFLSS